MQIQFFLFCGDPYCRQVLKGIRRTIGTEQVQKAATLPLTS